MAAPVPVTIGRTWPQLEAGRLSARGKFFFRGAEKQFLQSVTYGPFAPGEDGTQFPRPALAQRDFALMRELGANAIRTFTVPPTWLLDLAGQFGLGVLVGLPWTEHVAFLESPRVVAEVRGAVRDGVRRCQRHPAIQAYFVGNEIPPDIVRWLGAERVQAFVESLADTVKQDDPQALVSYANFPPTEYLDLASLDFVSFNVYLHREPDFRRYLMRLQNLAGDKPLVLTEFGVDSMREGPEHQAEILARQVRAAFELGVAGTSIFSWTDDWFTGGFQVEDWAFGLVDRERNRKPAFTAVQRLYRQSLPPPAARQPKISVVICAYNAERTMEACLQSLRELRYPDFEVIVVNDGSTDRTLEISQRFPEARIISQENKGLSVARNVGIEAATGEIVAFTDSDCVVDPDWLTYLAHTFVNGGFVAVGGPNLPPPEESRTAACVACSPGGPTHVLLNDDVAEHIPGCNMAFRRDELRALGGFDAIFRAAGDDVDLCWRLQDAGHVIGFSPAAMVWHFRRNTVKAYLKQQRGYGAAEAMLYFKHPTRFNMLGQSKWLGRIYGDLEHSLFLRRPVIYYGTFGRAFFQTLYEAPSSILAFLPFTLEWNLISVLILIGALGAGAWGLLGTLPLLVAFVAAGATAWRARLDPRYDTASSRALVALLTYLGPLLRSWERYRARLEGTAPIERVQFTTASQRPRIDWRRRAMALAFWSEEGIEKETLLQAVIDFLKPRGFQIAIDQGWSAWDVEVHRGLWARANLMVAVENHGSGKRVLRVRAAAHASFLARAALGGLAAGVLLLALLAPPAIAVAGALLGGAGAALIARSVLRLGGVVHQVVEIAATRLGLSAAP
ncbi:MAG: glycosyltransferase [Deltaproteobacteria bacterium]|nr:glycosyltransferase [Deltaproteobacteria bacterium]